ncbi:RelA/SpoT domain-containing protein [uncultured Vibrio sp.]|uniref:RelA/SpoT domain-containing protein n=1 Tax=uncultured Vibrio sp. TaxID=114054 RepID=UPI000915124E|nr:RelA/SpoT domain-containing protein [uncultured Vibrio sp.]OIQ26249.1 MAG: phosphoribosylglycinamide formyltransferase [Vibrio sp. MedPE-SWchi]
MNLFLRTTAIMLFMLTRTPAFAALPMAPGSDDKLSPSHNEVCAKLFKHNLSGLYGIPSTDVTPLQQHSDFDTLYSKSHQGQYELEDICNSTALLTQTNAYFAGIKSSQRAQEKIKHELNGKVERITDIARATIVADDVESLMEVYEALDRETDIVKVKNRFKNPAASGYRDLNLLVKLPKTNIIAEVQLHLKAIADVKNGPEHELYEVIQHIERNAAYEQRELTQLEVTKISKMRSQSLQMYQDAWQPYITTHLKAA